MKISSVEITQEQRDFLEKLIFEDAANSIGGAQGELGNSVQWCIDACIKIEELYGIDACYVSHFDIRLPEHDPTPNNTESIRNGMSVVYWNNARNMTQEEFTKWLSKK